MNIPGIQQVLELSESIARRLAEIPGVEAVALGGSWARGDAHLDSDIDLGIYYRPVHLPAVEELRSLARELDDCSPEKAVTEFGEWGPWINGGGRLTIEGRSVDFLYRDLTLVEQIVEDCRAGRTSVHYQPGHPHGFHTHIYMGEVHHCRILYDANSILTGLKRQTADYPPLLKRSIILSQLWEAGFALETALKPSERNDAFYVAGCFFRCTACLVQVLFALNEEYILNEKGSVEITDSLPLRPEDFRETVHSVLSNPGRNWKQLQTSIQRLRKQLEDMEKICDESISKPG